MNRRSVLLSFLALFNNKQESKIYHLFSEDDARLNKIISLVDENIWLGDLCAKLTELSGVTIRCSEKRNGDGEKLFVALKSVQLGDVLEAIWSLEGYRRATWEWQQTKVNGALVYTLERTPNAVRLPGDLNEDIQSRFEKFALRKIQISQFSDEEIDKLSNSGDRIAQDVQKDKVVRNGLRLIGSSFSGNRLKYALRGQEQKIPKGSISKSNLKDATEIWKKMGVTLQDGSNPDFNSLSISISHNSLSPSFNLSYYFGENGGTGWPYIGDDSFEEEINTDFPRGWLLNGDQKESPVVTYAPNPKQAEKAPLLRVLKTITEDSESLSILAHLPRRQNDSQRLARQSTHDIFAQFRVGKRQAPICKVRNGVVLLSYPDWFLGETNTLRVPLALFRKFEAKVKLKSIDPLDLTDIADAALLIAPEALGNTEDTFPQLKIAKEWQSFLSWARQKDRWEAALSPRGVLLTAALRQELANLPPLALVNLPNELWMRLSAVSERGRWGMRVVLLDRKQRVVASAESTLAPPEYPPQ